MAEAGRRQAHARRRTCRRAERRPGEYGRKVRAADQRRFRARFVPSVAGAGWTLHGALLANGLASHVTSGENGGRTLKHEFVAVRLASVRMDQAGGGVFTAPLELEAPAGVTAQSYSVAFWVSRNGEQKPIQAVGGDLPPVKRVSIMQSHDVMPKYKAAIVAFMLAAIASPAAHAEGKNMKDYKKPSKAELKTRLTPDAVHRSRRRKAPSAPSRMPTGTITRPGIYVDVVTRASRSSAPPTSTTPAPAGRASPNPRASNLTTRRRHQALRSGASKCAPGAPTRISATSSTTAPDPPACATA